MITLHAANETDFSTLGICALTPTECKVTEESGGAYELELRQPVDDTLRYAELKQFRIIKAPVPARETPLLAETSQTTETVTVQRKIYKTTGQLRLRAKPTTESKTIRIYKKNTKVILLEEINSSWFKVAIKKGGATGYMGTRYLEFVENLSDTITTTVDTPGKVVEVLQSREQLFRIDSVETDTKENAVIVKAKHITYDLSGAMVNSVYEPKEVPAKEVCQQLMTKLDHDVTPFEIYCQIDTKITGDYSGKNLLECLFNVDSGIVAQCNARVFRDNFTIYILPDEMRDLGMQIRYGKNLLSASMTTDTSGVITRIKPVGKTKKGDPLYITENNGFVDSPHLNEYPVIYTKLIEYDVAVSEDLSTTAAREKLKKLAEEDFKNGIDAPKVSLNSDFVRLELTEKYKKLANAYSLHLYDSAQIIAQDYGIVATVRMVKYAFDCINQKYIKTELGDIVDTGATVYGYEIMRGTLDGNRLITNTVNGDKIRNLSVEYAKISNAAIEQLSADAITAVTARIDELVAGNITTDELYAGIADISKATIEKADIDWANINELQAAIANITQAEIGSADIGFGQIKDLVAGTAIITEGVGGQLFISRLAVTEANMVSLTVGELVVKGKDGSFYSVSVGEDGQIETTLKQIGNDDVKDLSLNAGEKLIEGTVTAACLNATDIFANNAIISKLIAANIDVTELFANNAFVSELYTSKIYGGKSIEMIAGEAEAAQNAADAANGTVQKTVKTVDVEYYLSNSATELVGGSWSTTAPAWVNGKFMWSRTTTILQDGTVSHSNVTCIAGAKGETGAQGIQGLQGPRGEQGIPGPAGADGANGQTSYFHIKYSSVSKPTSSSQMTETPSTYIGTYVDYTAADSTDPSKYTWARFQGLQGAKGEQGIPGTNGENGQTSYLHIKYSNDGGKTFTSNNGEMPGDYIGQYTDFNVNDSGSVSSYKWAKIKGATGATGNGVVSIVEQFYLSDSKNTQTGGSWQGTMPTWTKGKYVWTRSKITYTNGSTTYTEPYCDTGWEAANDAQDIAEEAMIHTGENPPAHPIPDGKKWVDTSNNPWQFRSWLGADVPNTEDYLVAMPAAGKNLFRSLPDVYSYGGMGLYSDNSGGWFVHGTSDAVWVCNTFGNETSAIPYFISTRDVAFTLSGGSANVGVAVIYQKPDGTNVLQSTSGTGAKTFTLPAGAAILRTYIRVDAGVQVNYETVRPQLEMGTEATAYAAYAPAKGISIKNSKGEVRVAELTAGHIASKSDNVLTRPTGVTLRVSGDDSLAHGGGYFYAGGNVIENAPFELGGISNVDGSEFDNAYRIRSGFIPLPDALIPGVYLRPNPPDEFAFVGVFFYDAAKRFLGASNANAIGGGYMRLVFRGSGDEAISQTFAESASSSIRVYVDAFGGLRGAEDQVRITSDGEVIETRRTGCLILDGVRRKVLVSELPAAEGVTAYGLPIPGAPALQDFPADCSHFRIINRTAAVDRRVAGTMCTGTTSEGSPYLWIFVNNSDLDSTNNWLKKQADAGTPITVIYRLGSERTKTIGRAQPITPPIGDSTLATDATINHAVLQCSGWEIINDTAEIESALGEAQLGVEEAQEAANQVYENLERRIRLDSSGLHVGDSQTNNELLMQSALIHFVINGQRVSTIASDYHRFGNMEIRTPSSAGGIVIQAVQ